MEDAKHDATSKLAEKEEWSNRRELLIHDWQKHNMFRKEKTHAKKHWHPELLNFAMLN